MSLKSDKLAKVLQAAQSLLAPYVQQDDRLYTIAQNLTHLATTLKASQPTLQIVSTHPSASQALQQLLSQAPTIAAEFHMALGHLPKLSSSSPQGSAPQPAAALSLQTSTQSYPLSTRHPCLIGRVPDAQIPIPDCYGLVSGRHAEVTLVPKSATELVWRIQDASRNGTYVNGESVKGTWELQTGDRITLGLPYPTDTCPELVFEAAIQTGKTDGYALDCDVLCLVIDPTQPLTPAEQTLIQQANQTPIAKCYLIAGVTESTVAASHKSQVQLAEIDHWLRTTHPNQDVKIVSLLLTTVHPELEAAIADWNFPKERDQLLKSLGKSVKRKTETSFAQRMTQQIWEQLDTAEAFLSIQAKALAVEAQRDLAKLKAATPHDFTATLDPIFKQIHQDKTSFFKQAKEYLKLSKTDLLDDYLADSISSKIRCFVYDLKISFLKQGRRKQLQLGMPIQTTAKLKRSKLRTKKSALTYWQSLFKGESCQKSAGLEMQDANTALMNFCQGELSFWAEDAWDQLCQTHKAGINGLVKQLLSRLNSLSYLELGFSETLPFRPNKLTNFQSIFAGNFTQPSHTISIKEPSPLGHILKKVRSQWMQFIFLFSFLSILGIAGRRQIMRYLSAPLIEAFQVYPWISTGVFSLGLYFLARLLIHTYQEDRDLEREKEAKKLRESLCNHYQALVKNRFVDKLVQILETALITEEKSLEAWIKTIHQCIIDTTAKSTQSHVSIQQQADSRRKLYRTLEQDRNKLHKLKISLKLER